MTDETKKPTASEAGLEAPRNGRGLHRVSRPHAAADETPSAKLLRTAGEDAARGMMADSPYIGYDGSKPLSKRAMAEVEALKTAKVSLPESAKTALDARTARPALPRTSVKPK